MDAGQRVDAGDAPARAHDHGPVYLLPEDGVRRAHVIRTLRRDGGGFDPEPRLLHRRRRLVHDLVTGRPAVLQRQVVTLKLEVEARHAGSKHPQRLLQELLARLVPLHYYDGLAVHSSRTSGLDSYSFRSSIRPRAPRMAARGAEPVRSRGTRRLTIRRPVSYVNRSMSWRFSNSVARGGRARPGPEARPGCSLPPGKRRRVRWSARPSS